MTEHQIRSGRVWLSGQLESCSVVLDSREDPQKFESTVLLLQASGFISDVDGNVIPCLTGIFQFPGPLGPRLAGGLLVSARFAFAEFEVEAFDDVFIVRKSDSRLLLPPWTDCMTDGDASPADAAAPAEMPSTETKLDAAEPDASEEESSELPGPGDVLEHFRFGHCRVLRIDGSDILEVMTPSKNKARLSMSVLLFELTGTDADGTRHFKARPNRER